MTIVTLKWCHECQRPVCVDRAAGIYYCVDCGRNWDLPENKEFTKFKVLAPPGWKEDKIGEWRERRRKEIAHRIAARQNMEALHE